MSTVDEYPSKPDVLTATVASSAQLSSEMILHGCVPVAFETPAAITGTTYTFFGSIDKGVTFVEVRNNIGNAITYLTVAADGVYSLDPALFIGLDSIKINTGTNEASERTLKLKTQPI